MSSIQLIAGLGNPGAQYARTLHNIGFWLVDELARQGNAAFRREPKFFGEVCEVTFAGRRVRLLKPETFMNLSGQSLLALMQFYKLAIESVLVAHDEIDLPPGTLRLKQGGWPRWPQWITRYNLTTRQQQFCASAYRYRASRTQRRRARLRSTHTSERTRRAIARQPRRST